MEQKDNYLKNRRTFNYIASNDVLINDNKTKIESYEKERDNKISEIKKTETTKLDKSKSENKKNVWRFILMSAIIEFLIIIGVFFNKFYFLKTMNEYEENVVKTVAFKKWRKFDTILDFIFSNADLKIDEPIISSSALLEIIKINEMDISKNDLEAFFKIAGHLQMYVKEGNRRILKKDFKTTKELLKNHFKIN